jgi:predicted GIY-YIG superfamily endonuclease
MDIKKELNFDYEIEFKPEAFDKLDRVEGVYFLFDKEDKLLYIGKSNNIGNRLYAHYSPTISRFEGIQDVFAKVRAIKISSPTRRNHFEKYLIEKYKPIFNVKHSETYEKSLQEKELERFEYERNYYRYELNRLQQQYNYLLNQYNILKQRKEDEASFFINKSAYHKFGIEYDGDEIWLRFDNEMEADLIYHVLEKYLYYKKKYEQIKVIMSEEEDK